MMTKENDLRKLSESQIEARVFEQLRKFKGHNAPSDEEPPEVTRKTNLFKVKGGLGYDSLDLVEAIMELEEEFSVFITEDDSDRIRTAGDVVDAVKRSLPSNFFQNNI